MEGLTITTYPAVNLIAAVDFTRTPSGTSPPGFRRRRPRPERRHTLDLDTPSLAEIQRLTRLVIAEMVRAVRLRQGPFGGPAPPGGFR